VSLDFHIFITNESHVFSDGCFSIFY